jgi:molecular chaperone GrpE (heat shock protein)
MTKEKLFDSLNKHVEELVSKYTSELILNAEKILQEHSNSDNITVEEIEQYIKEQEEMFLDIMETILDDIRKKLEQQSSNHEETKDEVLGKVHSTFKRIFGDIITKLRSLIS